MLAIFAGAVDDEIPVNDMSNALIQDGVAGLLYDSPDFVSHRHREEMVDSMDCMTPERSVYSLEAADANAAIE